MAVDNSKEAPVSSLDSETLNWIKNDDLDELLDSVERKKLDIKMVVLEAGRRGAMSIVNHYSQSDAFSLEEDRDPQGNTILHSICQGGHLELVKTTMDRMTKFAIDVFVMNEAQETALHSACVSGKLDLIVFLIEEANFHPDLYNKDGLNALHCSCKYGSLDIVKYLIVKQKMDPTNPTSDSDGVSIQPIHFAAMYGHRNIVIYLIEDCGCDPHAQDNRGRSVLYLASDGGDRQLMEYLINECHCDPFIKTKKFKQAAAGRTALHAASFQGHLEVIKFLIENRKFDSSIADEANVTPLACAAQEGKIDTVKYLIIDCKADPNTRDSTGRTPFHYACLKNQIEVIKAFIELCESSLDINMLDNNGETGIIVAAKAKHMESVQYLVSIENCHILNDSSQSGRSVLHYAAAHGWIEVVTHLVKERHFSPEEFDSAGLTSVHHSADSGALEVLKFFIQDCKCDTNMMSKEGDIGHTPLLKACSRGKITVVKYLIGERGCSIIPSHGKAMHPIHLACSGGHTEVAKYLLEEGNQDLNKRDKQGALPIHFAVLNGHLELTKELIETYKADPMATTQKGATAIHAACQGGHLELLKYLIEEQKCHQQGAFNSGGSPLHRAVEHGHADLAKYLIEEGICAPNIRDNGGRTALHFTAIKGLVDLAQYLLEKSSELVMVQDAVGVTPLHLACSNGEESVVEVLLTINGSSQVICKDGKGQTPLQMAKQSGKITDNMLKMFLEHGAPATDLMEASPTACGYLSSYEPLYSYLKVFLIGEYQELIREFKGIQGAMSTRPETIHPSFPVVSNVQTKLLNDAMFYELPTVPSCSSSFVVDVLRTCRHPVVIVSVDSYKKCNLAVQDAVYWLGTFTDTLKRSDPEAKCQPLLLFELDDNEQSATLCELQNILSTLEIPGYTILNSSKSGNHCFIYSRRTTGETYGANRTVGKIGEFANILPNTESLPPLVCALRAFLQSSVMNTELYCTLQELIDKINSSDVLLLTDPDQLAAMLSSLCQDGYIVFMRNQSDLLLSWIVRDVPLVFELLQLEIKSTSKPLGMIRQSELLSHCQIDTSLILSLMKYYGACVEITDPILYLNESSPLVNMDDPLYYFPLVLPPNPPPTLKMITKPNQVSLSWVMQCKAPSLFPNSFIGLLPILPLCVDVELVEKTTLNGSIAVWSNGIHWGYEGLKVAVVISGRKSVLVVVKGSQNKLLEVTKKRNRVVKSLRNFVRISCEENKDKMDIDEFVVLPETVKCIEFNAAFPSISAIPLPDIEDDYERAETIVQCPYKAFMGFEPYHLLKHIDNFFDEVDKNSEIALKIVADLSKRFSPFDREIQRLFTDTGSTQHQQQLSSLVIATNNKPHDVLKDWVESNGATYDQLWNKLKQYSLYND